MLELKWKQIRHFNFLTAPEASNAEGTSNPRDSWFSNGIENSDQLHSTSCSVWKGATWDDFGHMWRMSYRWWLYIKINLSGVQISFRHFLSKIGHLLWKNGTLCFIRSIVHGIVLIVFGTNLDSIMLPVPRLRTLSALRYVLCLRCQIHRS